MHAHLIVGQDLSEIENVINNILKKNASTRLDFQIEKIENVRELGRMLRLKFNQNHTIVIKDIYQASEEAQNAFLKNLEEPPENIDYILTTNNIHGVIPTIVSRCRTYRLLVNKKVTDDDEHLNNFLNSDIQTKINIITNIKERGQAIEFITSLIYHEQKMNNFSNMEIYIKTVKCLKLNCNVSLQLLNLVVTMNSQD